MKNIKPLFELAGKNLKRHKSRTFLAMLGIFIGISAVVLVNSVGGGAQSLIINQIQSLGTNLVGIMPGNTGDKGPPAAVFGITIKTLTLDDLEEIRKVPHVIEAEGISKGMATISYKNQSYDSSFNGVSYSMPIVENVTLETGRFFTKEEDNSLSKVAVLGSELKTELFQDQDPIGKKIKIKNNYFKVIGVLTGRGSTGISNTNNVALIPVQTSNKLLLGIKHLALIRTKIDKTKNIEFTMEEIRKVLRVKHGIRGSFDDDFSVRSLDQAISMLSGITGFLRTFLSVIASISLVVGGVGIMNIMYVTVTERTKEIGIRKAIGATNKSILRQFLIEASLITMIGGLLGIIIGFLLSYVIYLIAQVVGLENWEFVISWYGIIVAFLITVGIGIAFGYYPAIRASKLNPVEALRYE